MLPSAMPLETSWNICKAWSSECTEIEVFLEFPWERDVSVWGIFVKSQFSLCSVPEVLESIEGPGRTICLLGIWTWNCPNRDLGRNGTWQSGVGNLDLRIVGEPRIHRVQDFICFFLLVACFLKGNLEGCLLRPIPELSHLHTGRTQWIWLTIFTEIIFRGSEIQL